MFDTYTIDNSAIMDLHGYNPSTSYTNDPNRREQVWHGMESLITDGRLSMVRPVRDEMKRRAPDCYERLRAFEKQLVRQDTADLLIAVGQIIDQFEGLVGDLNNRSHTREPR